MDIGFDGMIAAWWVADIADIASPKAATEIGAASTLDLHLRLVPDGLKTPADTADIDNSKLFSTFTTQTVGRRSFNGLSIKYVRGDEPDEKLYDDVLVYRASGFLVVRRDVAALVAPAAGQKVEVYPAMCKQPVPDDPGPNALQMVTVPMTLIREPKALGDLATLVL